MDLWWLAATFALLGYMATPAQSYSDDCVSDVDFSDPDCQISINEDGRISVPGCGAECYPPKAEWERLIEVEEGKIVELTVDFLDVDYDSSYCEYQDHMGVYDGDHKGNYSHPTVIKYLCGNETEPMTLYSTGNMMLLTFHSDRYGHYTGLKGSFRAVDPSEKKTPEPFTECGGKIVANSGNITSPNYPNKYPNNARCVWDIELENPDGKLKWRVHNAYLEHDFDELKYVDPLNKNGSKLYQGDAPVGNKLQIIFTSDETITRDAFRIDFEDISDCGGTIEAGDSWTVLNSPNYHRDVPDFMTCQWTVNVPEGKALAIEFDSFHFGNRECASNDTDKFTIHDNGGFEKDYCGFSYGKKEVLEDPKGRVTIDMRTGDPSKRDKYMDNQFVLKFLAFDYVDVQCNDTLIATPKKSPLVSPGYPGYRRDGLCQWSIKSQEPGGRVAIKFTQFDTWSCSKDYVMLYDEGQNGTKEIGKVCDYENERKVLSTEGPEMTVKFFTDSYSTYGNGFKAEYWHLGPRAPNCGVDFTGASGSISFNRANVDVIDDDFLWCRWIITVPEGSTVDLEVKNLRFDTYNGCEKKSFKLYDGTEPSEENEIDYKLIRCEGYYGDGNVPLAKRFVSSKGNQMIIEYKDFAWQAPDYYDSARFEASWPADQDFGKLHELTKPTGVIQSPNYPGDYGGLIKDNYLIKGPTESSRIKVTFHDIDLEECSSCDCDYLIVLDGASFSNPIGKMCTNLNDDILKGSWFLSESNQVRIIFGADRSRGGRGFKISYSIVEPDSKDYNEDCFMENTHFVSDNWLLVNTLVDEDGDAWPRTTHVQSTQICQDRCVANRTVCEAFSTSPPEPDFLENVQEDYDYYGYSRYGYGGGMIDRLTGEPLTAGWVFCNHFPPGIAKVAAPYEGATSGKSDDVCQP